MSIARGIPEAAAPAAEDMPRKAIDIRLSDYAVVVRGKYTCPVAQRRATKV